MSETNSPQNSSRGKRIDLTGQRFGRWRVIEFSHSEHSGAYWRCVCDCGNVKIVSGLALRNEESQSCGCLRKELKTKHGQSGYRSKNGFQKGSKEYVAWCDAKARCENPKNNRWYCYGAIGIKMCDEWRNDFAAFFAYMGKRPHGKTLGRIDEKKGYEPGNCEWQDKFKQANTKTTSRRFTLGGKTMTIAEWGRFSSLNPAFIYTRLYKGWLPERIFDYYLPLTSDSFRLWFSQLKSALALGGA